MKPAISLFLSIASLARVRSKSPNDMSHAARLALRLAAQAALGSSYPSSGPCHDISSTHAKPTPGPCQPTCRTTLTAALQ
ncbi:hypothetical protein ACFX10_042497 [Malus domestica]